MKSIVKYLPELPEEGEIVYCDNGKFSPDRARFKNGAFIGGGEFPVPEYKMSHTTKWFNLKEYRKWHENQGINGYSVSFEIAERVDRVLI